MPSARSAQTSVPRSVRGSGRQPAGAAATAGTRPAQTQRSTGRARAQPPRPRRVTLRSPVVRVRWERVGRIALLVVLLAVVGVYAEHALSYVSTREQASSARATYVQLAREHRALQAQARSLSQPSTIAQRARSLGMTRDGEQPYVINGQAGR